MEARTLRLDNGHFMESQRIPTALVVLGIEPNYETFAPTGIQS